MWHSECILCYILLDNEVGLIWATLITVYAEEKCY